VTDVLLPVAGAFIYVAASDLIPELRRAPAPASATRHVLAVLLGVVVMRMPLLLE
jgi:zinc transporter ZupT